MARRLLTSSSRSAIMHIEVVGDESISRQARTYAEYRLFAALPYVIDPARVRQSQMVLHRVGRGGDDDGGRGAVAIELDSGDILRLTPTADHPYAAINRAIEQLRRGPLPLAELSAPPG